MFMHYHPNTQKRKKSFPKWTFILTIGICLGALLSQSQLGLLDNHSLRKSTSKFYQVLDYIKQDYVDTTDLQLLTDTAISQLLEQLDPHSSYISTKEQALLNIELEGEFTGIGVEFVLLQDTIYVIAPVAGGPAEKAGIQPGDQIIQVNGQLWAGQNMKLAYILENLRGPQGSQVTLSVKRENYNQLLELTITRDKIHTHSINAAYMVDQETGYIKLSRFTNRTYQEFMEALDKLKAQRMKRLLLDLQNNPGGYLDQVVQIIEQMLEPNKLILYTQGKASKYNKQYYAKGKNTLHQIPIIVLINEGSASASEVLAGALQDHDRALIVGRRSFGKGLVQRPIQLSDGSELRLTVARYYTPSGRFIQNPYEKEGEDYQSDLINRYQKGEYFHADSIQLDQSMQYKTAAGRTVYGGGGIMPDYFVPLDTTQYDAYVDQLLVKYVLQQYALEYTHSHKNSLASMPYAAYYDHFVVTEPMLTTLYKKAQAVGIVSDKPVSKNAQAQIKLLLKAFIARNIWREEGYYPLLNQRDPIFKKALQLLSQAEELLKTPPPNPATSKIDE
jgi:carboxyl-terminal processing protease